MTFRIAAAVLALFTLVPAPAAAQGEDAAPIDVVDVRGPLDERAIEFMIRSIETSDAQAVVLQIDSPGVLTESVTDLIALLNAPPLPVAVWIGPEPARAQGGVAQLLAAAPIRAAAPGVVLGHLTPTVAGEAADPAGMRAAFPEVPGPLLGGTTRVTAPIPGLVDVVVPSIGQLIVGIDGVEVITESGPVTLRTARLVVGDDGVERPEAAAQVRFDKGSLFDRTLRLAVRPEAAFFFLVAGLSLAAFEFYAAGAGLMAGVGLLALLLAGYGIVVLPVRWWALIAVVAGLGLYTADFQRGDLGWRSLLGTAALFSGGLWFVDGAPQISTLWWAVTLVVVGAALFFGIGMTAVVRARFSTATIGREHLIGRRGRAETSLDPDGVVSVEGARWRATGHRAAGIVAGDDVEVVAVSGIVLEVEPTTHSVRE